MFVSMIGKHNWTKLSGATPIQFILYLDVINGSISTKAKSKL